MKKLLEQLIGIYNTFSSMILLGGKAYR